MIAIVTAEEAFNTQKGPVVAVFHQYAYTGKGKTILSCAQLEAFKHVVYDKSLKFGGKQKIETIGRYIIPLNIWSGLPYITIQLFTDKEWDKLPHMTLTANVDWDSSIVDCEQENN